MESSARSLARYQFGGLVRSGKGAERGKGPSGAGLASNLQLVCVPVAGAAIQSVVSFARAHTHTKRCRSVTYIALEGPLRTAELHLARGPPDVWRGVNSKPLVG